MQMVDSIAFLKISKCILVWHNELNCGIDLNMSKENAEGWHNRKTILKASIA